jgi:two-component system CheB/CheR fusion protein
MLSDEAQNPEDKKILDNIIKSTENINHLMSDLLDAAMMQTGKLQINTKEFVFNELVEDIYNQYNIIARQRNIVFRKVDFPVNITVTADRFRLAQVISNLVNNAFKFTPAGGVVELRYLREQNHIRLMVIDSGSGLVHLERVKIFEKFQQSEALAEELRKLGWGLGLSIARDIIEAHNGAIGADSAGLGKGSVFWFAIPLDPKVPIQVNPKA